METKQQAEKVREKSYQLCQEYLQGKWKEIKPSQLVIRQISGGLTNVVFYVGLPKDEEPLGQEPNCVLLRLFGELGTGPQQQFRLIQETVVFTMLSERNLGPKLHGVFPGGRLEEFIPGRPMVAEELRMPVFCEQIAKNFAMVHSLEVPVSKEPTWIGDTIRSCMAKLNPLRPELVPEEERPAIKKLNTFDFRKEMDWLLSFLRGIHSPVVFSHNDVNCGNILVRDQTKDWDPVVLIDYEFSAYNFRGFDIANHFVEWKYDYGTKEFPYFTTDKSKYPDREQQRRWVRKYLDTYNEQKLLENENNLCTKQVVNNTEQIEDILDEISAFVLASHVLWAVWAMKQGQNSKIQFSYFTYAADRMTDYEKDKKAVIELYQAKKGVKRKIVSAEEQRQNATRQLNNLNFNPAHINICEEL